MSIALLLVTTTTAAAALAQPPGGSATLADCRALSDSAARLACYDALPLPAASTADDTAKPMANFGFSRWLTEQGQPTAIESRIEGRLDGWGPRSMIKLANGQVWQIDDGSSGVFTADQPKVKVSKGALGALYLEIEGLNTAPRVKRIR